LDTIRLAKMDQLLSRRGIFMKLAAFLACAACSACLTCLAPSARADLIPSTGGWTYGWTHNPNTVWAKHSDHDSGITLVGTGIHQAAGSSDIIAVYLKPFSDDPRNHPAHFAHAVYSLTLYLLDNASHTWGQVTFHGFFTGTLSSRSADIRNHFVGDKTDELHLGQHWYTITIGHYGPPGPPGSGGWGSIGAHVRMTHNPEPSSLALAGLGLPLLGGAMWWGCRKRQLPKREG
jgi:hypothetical protein